MTSATARRFDQHVDRSGEHHLWTGTIDSKRGTGRIQVDARRDGLPLRNDRHTHRR